MQGGRPSRRGAVNSAVASQGDAKGCDRKPEVGKAMWRHGETPSRARDVGAALEPVR